MSRRNTSQRPPEPPQDRSDRLRAGRPAPTSSVRREKQALRPPIVGRGRGGETRLARVDAAGGSTSQTSPSQTVDLTQYQQDYQVYEQAQDQTYHFEEVLRMMQGIQSEWNMLEQMPSPWRKSRSLRDGPV